MRHFITVIPLFVPGLIASIAVGALASGRVGRSLGVRRTVAWAIVTGMGIILSATVTPLGRALDGADGSASCDLKRVGIAPLTELLVVNETSLNVLLFLPLGAAIGLVPRTRRGAALVVAAIALPFAIEATQSFAPLLNRSCQSADIADNLTGLAIGLAVGSIVGRLAPALAAPGPSAGQADPRPRL